jgi:hypothetical protein
VKRTEQEVDDEAVRLAYHIRNTVGDDITRREAIEALAAACPRVADQLRRIAVSARSRAPIVFRGSGLRHVTIPYFTLSRGVLAAVEDEGARRALTWALEIAMTAARAAAVAAPAATVADLATAAAVAESATVAASATETTARAEAYAVERGRTPRGTPY